MHASGITCRINRTIIPRDQGCCCAPIVALFSSRIMKILIAAVKRVIVKNGT